MHLLAERGKIVIVIPQTPNRMANPFGDGSMNAKEAKPAGWLLQPRQGSNRFLWPKNVEEAAKLVNAQEKGKESRTDGFIPKGTEA